VSTCWLDSGSARLRVEVAGAGVALLLVHGWAMDRRVFRFQVGALARYFKVVTYDRRGFGESGGSPDLDLDLEDLDTIADAVAGEAGTAAGGRFHLLGLSQGGRIAVRYAATRPGRLRSLILQGAAVDGDEPAGPGAERIPLEEFAELARLGRLGELRRRWLRHPLMQLGSGHPEAERLLRDMLDDYRGADLIDSAPARGPAADALSALAAAELPVLVLTGAQETAARRRTAERLVAAVPGAREILLGNSGHLCNLTEPEAYNAAVIAFCRAVDARAGRSGAGAQD
jgi:pimeloyl-ACP methyl ester carboxylesterase